MTKSKKILNSVDWTVFLERHEHPPYLISAFIPPEGSLMKKVTGFGFMNQSAEYKGDVSFYYRSKKDLEKCDLYFADFVKNKKNKKKITIWYKEAISHQKKAEGMIKEFKKDLSSELIVKNYKRYYELCENILLYTTSIPYFVLNGVEHAIEKDGAKKKDLEYIIKLLQKIRSKSYYNDITEIIFARFWQSASDIFNNKLSADYFSMLSPEEFEDCLKRKKLPDIKELKKRKKWCIFWADPKNDKIYFDTNKKNKIVIQKIAEKKNKKTEEIKGRTAFLGKAKGKVCIVNSMKDIDKMEKGDILVSVNTNPSLMPAILKSSAIITDEGGISCHAAIISREMKKPCITGTKNATKILKDGDIVEVDANAGLIRMVGKD